MLFYILCFFLTLPFLLVLLLRLRASYASSQSSIGKELAGKETIAFFHPYAHAGGGGERVLWCSIRAVQQRYPTVTCVVYTGDTDVTPSEFLLQAKRQFGVDINSAGIRFVFLHSRRWVDASSWKRFTLIGQSLGSLVVGWEALCQLRPDIYIDSMGYAFTLPLFSLLAGSRVGCYVHYPTISTDMLEQVEPMKRWRLQ
ncbi:unnamed protein product [Durusdinium trenchii]|uniref:ALG11 mannosyltransferase N-terminal domain-containing protein n=2 Tax=Durusdinium trenchii TaxID=1381693 RepID=A0ABP0MTT7_9DINO